jgi:hypothetical protein
MICGCAENRAKSHCSQRNRRIPTEADFVCRTSDLQGPKYDEEDLRTDGNSAKLRLAERQRHDTT